MHITTRGCHSYELLTDEGRTAGSLIYEKPDFSLGTCQAGPAYSILHTAPGIWHTFPLTGVTVHAVCAIKLDGRFLIRHFQDRYELTKPTSWKTRLCLLNNNQEELAALLPTLNPALGCFDFRLQLSEEPVLSNSTFLILQALHCAVLGMAILNGQMEMVVGDDQGYYTEK